MGGALQAFASGQTPGFRAGRLDPGWPGSLLGHLDEQHSSRDSPHEEQCGSVLPRSRRWPSIRGSGVPGRCADDRSDRCLCTPMQIGQQEVPLMRMLTVGAAAIVSCAAHAAPVPETEPRGVDLSRAPRCIAVERDLSLPPAISSTNGSLMAPPLDPRLAHQSRPGRAEVNRPAEGRLLA